MRNTLRTLFALAALAAAVPPAHAQRTQVLSPPLIDASGNLKLGPVTLGKQQGTKFTIDPGSIGSVDGATVGGKALSSLVGLSAVQMPPPDTSGATPAAKAAADAANFAAAQATGAKVIVFQAGTYLVPPNGYAKLKSGQYIRGQGSTLTKLKIISQGTNDDGMLVGLDISDAGIYGMTVDYDKYFEPQSQSGVIGLRHVDRFRMEDVDIINFNRRGLSAGQIADFSYIRGNITKVDNPRDAFGAPIPKGQISRCVGVSQATGQSIRMLFQDIVATNCGFGVGGAYVDYVRTEVIGHDYGLAYVTDLWREEDHPGDPRLVGWHRFINVKASLGRTDPSDGKDRDDTSAGCFEIWAQYSLLEGSECSDMGGDGVVIGGKNVRVINNKFRKLGMVSRGDAIGARYFDSTYNADGAYISGNIVENTNGSGDGSDLRYPYASTPGAPEMKIKLVGNDFGTTPLPSKNTGEVWSAPGMLVTAHGDVEYGHTPCSQRGPASITVSGVLRQKDILVGVTYKADDGSSLPPDIEAFATIRFDNTVQFFTRDIRQDCSSGGTTTIVKPGTFTARLVTIN